MIKCSTGGRGDRWTHESGICMSGTLEVGRKSRVCETRDCNLLQSYLSVYSYKRPTSHGLCGHREKIQTQGSVCLNGRIMDYELGVIKLLHYTSWQTTNTSQVTQSQPRYSSVPWDCLSFLVDSV